MRAARETIAPGRYWATSPHTRVTLEIVVRHEPDGTIYARTVEAEQRAASGEPQEVLGASVRDLDGWDLRPVEESA